MHTVHSETPTWLLCQRWDGLTTAAAAAVYFPGAPLSSALDTFHVLARAELYVALCPEI